MDGCTMSQIFKKGRKVLGTLFSVMFCSAIAIGVPHLAKTVSAKETGKVHQEAK